MIEAEARWIVEEKQEELLLLIQNRVEYLPIKVKWRWVKGIERRKASATWIGGEG